MNKDVEDFVLEHHGTKGMKWGVRRQNAELARRQRFATGNPTRKDKLISDLDLNRTAAERKAGIQPTPARGRRVSELNRTEKLAIIAVGTVFMARALRNYGKMVLG